jgi:hypothetical protein
MVERVIRRQVQEKIDALRPLPLDRHAKVGPVERIAMWPEGRENFALSITMPKGTLTIELTPEAVDELLDKMCESFREDQEVEMLFDA